MLRTCSCAIALNAMVAALSMTAQAADTTLTLACQGTVREAQQPDEKPEAISMGVIVDLAAKTVHFSYSNLNPFPIEITAMDEMTVTFGGSRTSRITQWVIRGGIDRVTGDFYMISTLTGRMEGESEVTLSSTSYALKCKPAQRMF